MSAVTAASFKFGASSSTFEIYLDDGSEWRWRAKRSSDKVAASGEAFDNKSNAERAADNVRDNAGSAHLSDLGTAAPS